MKPTVVFVYRLTSDDGLAPCVADGLITLVCCKGGVNGLRHYIGSRFNYEYKGTDVWVIGICGKAMSIENELVYIGQVQNAMLMPEYSKLYPNRADALYNENGRIANKNEGAHASPWQQVIDRAGKYALIFNKENCMHFYGYYLPLSMNRDKMSNRRLHKRYIINNEDDQLYQLIIRLKKEWFGKPIPDHPGSVKPSNSKNKKCVC